MPKYLVQWLMAGMESVEADNKPKATAAVEKIVREKILGPEGDFDALEIKVIESDEEEEA